MLAEYEDTPGRRVLLAISFMLLSAYAAALHAQSTLEPGKQIKRELKGGETHTFDLNLRAGEFLYLTVDQQGIDVAVTLMGPNGKDIFEVDSPNGFLGPESMYYWSETGGNHKVSIKSLEEFVGSYQIRIEEQRIATAADRQRAQAQSALIQGRLLLAQKTEASAKEATEKFRESLELWRRSGDSRGEAEALKSVGLFYAAIDEQETALEHYDRALAIIRDADKRQTAYVLYLIADEYVTSTVERKHKSLTYYDRALALMREVGDRWGEAMVLDQLGLVYGSLTETKKAFEYFNPLLSLQLSLGDQAGAAVTLNYIGGLHAWLGDYQKAMDYYSQAAPLARAVGYSEAEQFALRNVGTAYFGLGDYETALAYFEKVSPQTQNDPESHAMNLNDIGAVHAKLGNHQKALDYYNQALPIWRKLKAIRFEGSTLSNIGSAYRELGDYPKAFDFYNQALPLKQYVGDRRGEAAIQLNVGKVQLLMGDGPKGLESYRQALTISQAVGDQSLEAQAFDGMALAQRSLNNLQEARHLSESALKIVESLGTNIAARQQRTSYQALAQDYYDTYVDLLMLLHRTNSTAGYDALALEASERARARSLLESLNEARVDIRQGVDPELLEREQSLQQQLQAKAEVHTRLLSGKPTPEQIAASNREIETLLTSYHEVEGQIRIRSPRYAALTQTIAFSLKEIQQQLLDANTILLEYRLGKERSFLWAVTKNSLESYELPKRAAIETEARRVYDLLTARNRRIRFETRVERQARIARADADFPTAANALSKMILAPAAKLLGKNRLLIVSDGALHYIPFAALPAPVSSASSPPLIVNNEVVHLPSALALASLRRETTNRKPPAKTLAILADPVFDRNDARVKAVQPARRIPVSAPISRVQGETRALPPELLSSVRDTTIGDEPIQIRRLPFTRLEAKQITALVPQSDRKVALDFAASRATATNSELGQYRYLHFATHGFLNSAHPQLSGIVLSLVDEHGQDQEGFLRAFEIFNLKLPAEMVVLSGCRTGLGKEIKGEGLVGMTRGFMYAGAARVLVSLWDIPDEASAELMAQLYRGMLGKERRRPAAALRAAQNQILKEKQWQAPYYWAAFVLQGEPR